MIPNLLNIFRKTTQIHRAHHRYVFILNSFDVLRRCITIVCLTFVRNIQTQLQTTPQAHFA